MNARVDGPGHAPEPKVASVRAEPGLPAPAVATAMRILDYLSKHKPRAGVSEIARDLGVNKSSCFNVLLTLAHFGVVSKPPGQAKYQLGPRLAELGGAARRQYSQRDVLRRHFEDLVVETRLVCVIGQPLGDEGSFVIIDQIAPPGVKSRSPAPPVGTVVPMTGPALGRALLSACDEEDAISIVHHLHPGLGPAEIEQWRQQLREVKAKGFATSIGQFQHDVNAVASTIEQAGEAYLVVGLIGHARDLPSWRIDEIAPRLAAKARALRDPLHLVGSGG